MEDWCDGAVMTFALQAMVNAVDCEALSKWYDVKLHQQHQLEEEEGGGQEQLRSRTSAAVVEEMAVDEAKEGDAATTAVGSADVMEVTEEAPQAMDKNDVTSSSLTFFAAYSRYDGGETYKGAFPSIGAESRATTDSEKEKEREAYAKRAVQLLAHVCLVDIRLLAAFTELFAVWAMGRNSLSSSAIASSEVTDAVAPSAAAEVPAEGEAVEAGSAEGNAESAAGGTVTIIHSIDRIYVHEL